jgi:DNA ligase-4
MYDPRTPPALFGKWSPKMSDRPDVYISDVSKSVVLEVKAGELVVSDAYPTFYTLRFPRVVRLRFDKDWHEGMHQKQLNELITNFNDTRRMNKHRHGLYEVKGGESSNEEDLEAEADEPGVLHRGRKKRKVVANGGAARGKHEYAKDKKVVEFYRETDTVDIKQETAIFEGLEFYIVNTDDLKGQSKPQLERLIVQHGGRKV